MSEVPKVVPMPLNTSDIQVTVLSRGYSRIAIILLPKAGRRLMPAHGGDWPRCGLLCAPASVARPFLSSPTQRWGGDQDALRSLSALGATGVRNRSGPCMQSQSLKFYPFKIDIIYLYMI